MIDIVESLLYHILQSFKNLIIFNFNLMTYPCSTLFSINIWATWINSICSAFLLFVKVWMIVAINRMFYTHEPCYKRLLRFKIFFWLYLLHIWSLNSGILKQVTSICKKQHWPVTCVWSHAKMLLMITIWVILRISSFQQNCCDQFSLHHWWGE